jgi:branched-subunit amino acid ABC-type transport system permease component
MSTAVEIIINAVTLGCMCALVGVGFVVIFRATRVISFAQGHDVSFVSATCDKIVVITSGRKIAEGDPAETLQHPDVVQAYIGG